MHLMKGLEHPLQRCLWIDLNNFIPFPSLCHTACLLSSVWLSCRTSLPQEVLPHAEVKGILCESSAPDLLCVGFDFYRLQMQHLWKCPNIRPFPGNGKDNQKFVGQAKLQFVLFAVAVFIFPSTMTTSGISVSFNKGNTCVDVENPSEAWIGRGQWLVYMKEILFIFYIVLIIAQSKFIKGKKPPWFQCICSLFLAAGSVWLAQQALDLFAAGFWSFQWSIPSSLWQLSSQLLMPPISPWGLGIANLVNETLRL